MVHDSILTFVERKLLRAHSRQLLLARKGGIAVSVASLELLELIDWCDLLFADF